MLHHYTIVLLVAKPNIAYDRFNLIYFTDLFILSNYFGIILKCSKPPLFQKFMHQLIEKLIIVIRNYLKKKKNLKSLLRKSNGLSKKEISSTYWG